MDDQRVSILERIGLEKPLVQAGMGGVSRHLLAAAVSEAGGLGTIAVPGAAAIASELAAARSMTSKPVAVNLLLPFARRSWFEAAAAADVVVTFWGTPKRRVPGIWLHQCGSVDEAHAARAAGADGVIVQGVEAGGHVRGTEPALELLERVKAALPDYPMFLAGGIATRTDVENAVASGADAAVAGTRFLLSDECVAHPEYKQRLLSANSTILTELFGFGWPAPHRVVANEATASQAGPSGEIPFINKLINRASAAGARFTPESVQRRAVAHQSPTSRMLTPHAPSEDLPRRFVEAGPLYAGETVARIDKLLSAEKIVTSLVG